MVVWKYLLTVGFQFVSMPQGARLLSVGEQDGNLCLWALVDPNMGPSNRTVIVVGTGGSDPGETSAVVFVGTIMSKDGLVWHVFDGGKW